MSRRWRAPAVLWVAALLVAVAAPATAEDPPFDPGTGWTMVAATTDERSADTALCEAGSLWSWSGGDRELTYLSVPCGSDEAVGGFWEWLAAPGERLAGAAEDEEIVRWDADGRLLTRGWYVEIGSNAYRLAVLTAHCPDGTVDDCLASTAAAAAAALDAEPGGGLGAERPGLTLELIILNVLVPVFLVAATLGIWRGVAALLRPGYTSASTSERYHDVARRVGRARRRRRARRILWGFVVIMAAIAVASSTTDDPSALLGMALFVVPVLVVLVIGYRTFLRPDPVERGRRVVSGSGAGAAVGSALSVLAVGVVGLILLVHVLVGSYGPMSEGWPPLTSPDLRRMDLPLLAGLLPLARSVGDDGLVVSMFLAIPALAAAVGIDVLGQRLRNASVDEALAQDDRPHYLYLRSFDEDRLKLPGQLRRRGLLSALSVMRKVRFEEVLVRQLSATGPVIAIAPPGLSMPPIGAARASFSNEEWQQHVVRYAETARAVVLSATPGEVRPGYGWELDLIANRIGHRRVLVVLGPWPRQGLRRRWTQFCVAVSHVPFFAPITMPWVPDGVHVLAHSARLGWHGWGAGRRLDWTYAVAIDEATRAYLPEWS